MVQRLDAEKNLHNAWIRILEVLDSVAIKKAKLQLLSQYLKLGTILRGQMVYLEDYSLMDREHSNSLSGAIEALKTTTLRLPVVSGARADLQEVKDAVGSALGVMQVMGASIYCISPKLEGTNSSVLELAEVAVQERVLLDQSRHLLSTVATLHVKQCSLQGQLLQLRRRTGWIQL